MPGIVSSWGDDTNGQLGTGRGGPSTGPAPIPDLGPVRDIKAGSGHALALLDDGTVWAWGRNPFGQLGIGTNQPQAHPVQVPGLRDIIAVDGGGGHSVALGADGTVWTWGAGFFGALGDDTPFMRPVPARVAALQRITGIAAGGSHSLALTEDGDVYTWGRDDHGQLADGEDRGRAGREVREYKGNAFACRPVPAKVADLPSARGFAVGGGHALVVLSDGDLIGWGFNDRGQVGDGSLTDHLAPVKVEGVSGVVGVAAGYHHSLVLLPDGTVLAWGLNDGGQLGDGTVVDRLRPGRVRNLSGAIAVAANGGGNDLQPGNGGHNLALLGDGTVVAWGWNDHGQLGDGSMENRTTPVPVAGLSAVRAIAVGGDVPPPREQPTGGTSFALQ